MRIKVLNLDGVPDNVGDIFDKNSELLFDEEIPVSYRYPQIGPVDMVGWAKLERDGDALYANIWRIEGKLVKGLTPSIAGKLVAKDGSHMSKVEIDCIQLTMTKNSDPRIAPIDVEE